MYDIRSPVVAERSASLMGRMFDSFRLPSYRIYWSAMMAQMGAMNMQMVARSWLIYELTNQYTMLGAMMLANSVPMLLLSLFGGVMADRVQKKRILQVGQAASALITLGVAIAITGDIVSLENQTGVGLLLASAAAQGLVMGLMMPARQAIVPELVGRARMMNAIALNASGMNINRLLIPGVGGLLIAIVGIQAAYYSMTGLYLLGAILVTMLPRTEAIPLGRRGAWGDLKEGLRYVRENTMVMGLLMLTLLSVLLSMPYLWLMPAFAKDVLVVELGQYQWLAQVPLVGFLMTDVPELLTQSSFRLGLLLSISGVGALVGSLLIGSMSSRNRGQTFLWSVLALGIFLALFSFTSSFVLALAFMIGVGLTQSARMALSNTLVQDFVDDEHRGRVMSVYTMEFGLTSFTTFGVSVLANVIGIQWAVGGSALLLIPLALFYVLFVPRMRRIQ